MKKRLTKVGNSDALLLDNAILKLLGIKKGTGAELTLKIEGGSLIVTPVREVNEKISEDEAVQKAFEKMMKRYAPALKKLAKN